MNLKLKIVNNGKLPEYKTIGSSGADCFARIDSPLILKPGERKLIPLGIAVEIPEGYEIQVRPRSGLAYKEGVTIINTPGTIDSDYRGEIHANLINFSKEDFIVNPDDRIAQIILSPVIRAEFEIVDSLSETVRGEGGHGSTGK